MIEKTCRCGKTKKNFQIDIGPFFIAECCTEAGYDHLGNKFEVESVNLKTEEVQKVLESKETQALEIVDDPKDDADEPEEVVEQPPQKKKRAYNRGGNLKKD